MEKRSQNTSAVPIGSVIKDVMKTCGRPVDHAMLRVWDCWDAAMGQPLAAHAQPAAVKGGILLVYVSSSVWIQQLRFLRHDIIDKLNSALGEDLVCDVKFKVGPLACGGDDTP